MPRDDAMGIIEDGVAKGLSFAWAQLPAEKRAEIRLGTIAGESGLKTFNEVTADDQVTSEELEGAISKILAALGSTAGNALQAYLWSLFKHA
jgi:hypothetical protein